MNKSVPKETLEDLLSFLKDFEGIITENSTRVLDGSMKLETFYDILEIRRSTCNHLIESLEFCSQPDYELVVTEHDWDCSEELMRESFKKEQLLAFIDQELYSFLGEKEVHKGVIEKLKLQFVNDETYPYAERDKIVLEIFKYE